MGLVLIYIYKSTKYFLFVFSFFFPWVSFLRKWGWCSLAFPGWQHAKGIKPVPYNHSPLTISQPLIVYHVFHRPSLKSALRPPPSALAESANFRPFYVKRADFSPPPSATKKRRKLVKIRPRCPHLATTKRRKVVKIRPCGGWWVEAGPPPFCLNLILSSNRSKYGKI